MNMYNIIAKPIGNTKLGFSIDRLPLLAVFLSVLAIAVSEFTVSLLIEFQPISLANLLNLYFLCFGCFIFTSNLVVTISVFFFHKDLEMYLAAPVTSRMFINSRLKAILKSSLWTMVLFVIPSLLVIGAFYNLSVWYYMVLPFILLATLILVAILTSIIILLGACLIQKSYSANLILILLLFTLISSGSTYFFNWYSSNPELIKIINSIPISYYSETLTKLSSNNVDINTFWTLTKLSFVTIILLNILYLLNRMCFYFAYTKIQNLNFYNNGANALLSSPPWLHDISRGFLRKDFKSFIRDYPQILQLVLLIILNAIYLGNLKNITPPNDLNAFQFSWWQVSLVVLNICMGTFMLLAICTRFVFPSVSIESSTLWIINSAPISSKDFLKSKIASFFSAILIIAIFIFTIGAIAITSDLKLILLTLLVSVLSAYVFTVLGVCLGTIFAKFDWQHSAELSVGLGSIVFMLACAAVCFINIVGVLLICLIDNLHVYAETINYINWSIGLASTIIVLVLINFSIANYSLRLAVKSSLK